MTSIPYHQSPHTPQEDNIEPSAVSPAPHFHVLALSGDENLDEVDDRYLELVCIWSGPGHPSDDTLTHNQLRVIDEAYQAILPRLMDMDTPSDKGAGFSIKNLEIAQDRIQPSSQDDNAFWIHPDVPPRPVKHGRDSPPRQLPPNQQAFESQIQVKSKISPIFYINEIDGDLLDAPHGAIIVHAVNCQGVWGSGVAKQLKAQFPAAFCAYQSYCKKAMRPADLAGKCLIIPPHIEDYQEEEKRSLKGKSHALAELQQVSKPHRWIACLFTSVGYGNKNMRFNNPGKDPPKKILEQTQTALESLRIHLEESAQLNPSEEDEYGVPGEIWSCKFNSGAFGVDWEETKKILESEFYGFDRPFTIVEKA